MRLLDGAPGRWWPEAALLLVYWAARLHHLAAYPVFDDESIHIRQAKMVWKLLPFSGADDGRVLNILLYAPFWPFGDGALWVSRAAGLLAGAAGFAALLGLGRMLFGRTAARWAGLVFIAMPFAFFFERLALADSLGLPFLALTASLSLRAARSGERLAASAAGLALACLLLSKLTNLVFLFVPLLPLLLRTSARSFDGGAPAQLRRGRQPNERPHSRPGLSPGWRTIAIYLVAAAVLAPFVLFLVFRAHSTLGFANVAVRTGDMPLAERLERQLGNLREYPAAYLTWPIWLLCLAGLVAGLARRSRGTVCALLLGAAPVALFAAAANSLESRYLAPAAAGLALLAGFGAEWAAGSMSRWLPGRSAAVAVAAAVGLGGPAQFIWTAWHAPERLKLAPVDQPDYVEDWPSGFGVEEAARLVLDRSAGDPISVVVTEGWHMAGLTVHYGWEQNLRGVYTFSEERLRVAWLQSGCDPFAPAGGPDPRRVTLFVTERHRYAETNACLLADKTLLAAFAKPGGAGVIEVYEIRPPP